MTFPYDLKIKGDERFITDDKHTHFNQPMHIKQFKDAFQKHSLGNRLLEFKIIKTPDNDLKGKKERLSCLKRMLYYMECEKEKELKEKIEQVKNKINNKYFSKHLHLSDAVKKAEALILLEEKYSLITVKKDENIE